MKKAVKELNKIFNQVNKDMNKEAKESKATQEEAEKGISNFIIFKEIYGTLFCLPEKDNLFKWDIQRAKEKREYVLLPKNKLKEFIRLRENIRKANIEYKTFLKAEFEKKIKRC
jgi:hypothetical protein